MGVVFVTPLMSVAMLSYYLTWHSSATGAAPLVKLGLLSLLPRTKSVTACSSIFCPLTAVVSKLFFEGRISLCTIVRVPDIRNVIVSGNVILPNQQVFRRSIIFSFSTKCRCGPGETASWAGFGPGAVFWRRLSYRIRRNVSAGLHFHCKILNLSWLNCNLLFFFMFLRITWISSTVVKVSIPLSSVHVYFLISLRVGLPYSSPKRGAYACHLGECIIYT